MYACMMSVCNPLCVCMCVCVCVFVCLNRSIRHTKHASLDPPNNEKAPQRPWRTTGTTRTTMTTTRTTTGASDQEDVSEPLRSLGHPSTRPREHQEMTRKPQRTTRKIQKHGAYAPYIRQFSRFRVPECAPQWHKQKCTSKNAHVYTNTIKTDCMQVHTRKPDVACQKMNKNRQL